MLYLLTSIFAMCICYICRTKSKRIFYHPQNRWYRQTNDGFKKEALWIKQKRLWIWFPDAFMRWTARSRRGDFHGKQKSKNRFWLSFNGICGGNCRIDLDKSWYITAIFLGQMASGGLGGRSLVSWVQCLFVINKKP